MFSKFYQTALKSVFAANGPGCQSCDLYLECLQTVALRFAKYLGKFFSVFSGSIFEVRSYIGLAVDNKNLTLGALVIPGNVN